MPETALAFFHEFFRTLIEGDHQAFHLINQYLANPLFDLLMPFVTNLHNTIFLLIGLAVYSVFVQKMKAVKIILGMLMAVACSDIFAAKVIKPLAHRQRPEFALKDTRLLVPSQKSFGFPSNHASNCFAAASFLGAVIPQFRLIAWGIAALVAFSRVYVGVHFPIDVFFGALFGIFWGLLFFHLWYDQIVKQPASWNKDQPKRRGPRFGRR